MGGGASRPRRPPCSGCRWRRASGGRSRGGRSRCWPAGRGSCGSRGSSGSTSSSSPASGRSSSSGTGGSSGEVVLLVCVAAPALLLGWATVERRAPRCARRPPGAGLRAARSGGPRRSLALAHDGRGWGDVVDHGFVVRGLLLLAGRRPGRAHALGRRRAVARRRGHPVPVGPARCASSPRAPTPTSTTRCRPARRRSCCSWPSRPGRGRCCSAGPSPWSSRWPWPSRTSGSVLGERWPEHAAYRRRGPGLAAPVAPRRHRAGDALGGRGLRAVPEHGRGGAAARAGRSRGSTCRGGPGATHPDAVERCRHPRPGRRRPRPGPRAERRWGGPGSGGSCACPSSGRWCRPSPTPAASVRVRPRPGCVRCPREPHDEAGPHGRRRPAHGHRWGAGAHRPGDRRRGRGRTRP